MRRFPVLALIAPVVVIFTLTSLPAAAATSDADWVLTAQLPDGAIAQYPDLTRITPYFANLAALGLAHAYVVSGNPGHVQAAEGWLSWYQDHMDANGYVTDYDLGPAPLHIETSTGDFDSTDAYAGTFLIALREWVVVQGGSPTRQKSRLMPFRAGIKGALKAILSTQDLDGLTWAKPSYKVKYLMDQSESYAGLRAAATLAGMVSDLPSKTAATAGADRLKAGLGGMWVAAPGMYANAKFEDGSLATTSWSAYYPDSVAQPWAVALGNWLTPTNPLIASARASSVVGSFASAWPQWSQPGAVVPFAGGTSGTVDYRPMVGGALVSVGRGAEGLSGVNAIDAYALANGRPWPFDVGAAGQVVLVRGS